MSKTKHHPDTGIVIRSASITFAGIVFQLAISFISGFIVARVIGPAAFGIFNISRTLCESATVFTKAGFDIGIVRYFGERQGPDCDRENAGFLKITLFIITVLSLAPVLFIYLGGGLFLERHIYPYDSFSMIMFVMVLSIPFMSLTQVLGGAFRGRLRIRPRVVAEFFLQPSSRLVIIIILFLIGWKLWAVITGTVFSFLLSTVYLLIMCRLIFTLPSESGVRKLPWRDLLSVGQYSIVISLTVSVALLLQRADVLMLGYFARAEHVGQYSVIQMVTGLIPIFNSSLNQAVAPMIAGFHAEGRIEEMRGLIHQHTRWVIIATFPFFLIIASFGNIFIGIFGKGYVVDVPVITLLALAQFVIAVLSSAGFMLSMTGRHYNELFTMLFALGCSVVLNYFLIPPYGLMGAGTGTLIAVVLANILRSIQVYRVHGIFPIGPGSVKPFIVGLVSFIFCIAALRSIGVKTGIVAAIITSAVFLAIYCMLIARFGVIEDDRLLLQKIMCKVRSIGSTT